MVWLAMVGPAVLLVGAVTAIVLVRRIDRDVEELNRETRAWSASATTGLITACGRMRDRVRDASAASGHDPAVGSPDG